MQKLKLGTVHLALPSSIMSSVADEFGLFDMPFLVKDREHLGRIEDNVFWSEIAPAAEAKGYKVLAVWENGIRHITNKPRPIMTPADLDGVKLRTPKSKWRVIMFKTWGANPTPMAFSEVFVALQTGVIDGRRIPTPTSGPRSSRRSRSTCRSPGTCTARPTPPPGRPHSPSSPPTCRKC